MARSDHVGSKLSGGLEESVELDLAVAQNVRIRGTTGGIFIEHVVHHPLAVLL